MVTPERDGELPEQPADDVAHEQQRDENGDERITVSERDGEPESARPL